MSHLWNATIVLALLSACGGAGEAPGGRAGERESAPARPDGEGDPSGRGPEDDIGAETEQTSGTPRGDAADEPGAAGEAVNEPLPSAAESFVTFVDPDSDFSTVDVHDADRQVVHFDAERDAMIWSVSDDAVSGWRTQGSDLSWTRSGVAFRVRFGTEAGERRAYFTETDRGTICNLTITGPESLAISATGETPPQE